jgi:hypothetical protein
MRPLVREGTAQRQDNKFQTQTLEKEAISGQTSTKWARHNGILTDCQQQSDSDSDTKDTQGQTRPLVREGAPQTKDKKFQTQTLEKEAISGQTSTKWARHQDILTD